MYLLNSLNWVDVAMVLLWGRIMHIGMKKGLAVEIFKSAGVFVSLIFSLHYYSDVAGFMEGKTPFSATANNLISYILIWVFVVFLFKIIRNGVEVLFKMQAHPIVDMWGGLILSAGRGALLCSLTVLALYLSGINFLKESTQVSLSASRLVYVAPKVYEFVYSGFMSKFFPNEKLNESVFALVDGQEQ